MQPEANPTATIPIDRRTPVDELPELMTVPEFMAYASVGRTAAYAFANKHGVRIGKLVRIPRKILASG